MNGFSLVEGRLSRAMGRGLAALVSCLFLAACAQNGAPTTAAASATPSLSPIDRLGVIGPQKLAAGQCGLFLWSRTTPPRLVLFSDGLAGTAHIMMDGRARILRRSHHEGEAFYGQFQQQRFMDDDFALALDLEADSDAGIVNGVKISRGLLRVEDSAGGYSAVPVAGMIACEAP